MQKEQIELCPGDFVLPVSFLLSMSLLGLEFPFAYILVFIILYFSWTINKYDFLLQSTLLFGVYGFYDENLTFPFKLHDLLFIVYFAGFFIYWKDKNIRRLLIPVSIYILFLFFVAMLSDEFLMIQARRLRLYMHILYFLFPLLVFRKQDFDIKLFFNKLFIYVLIISCFYIIDSLVVSNHIFVPRTTWGDLTYSTLEVNLLGDFIRKYPPGMYFIALLLFPMLYLFRTSAKYILIMALGLVCTKTFSVIGGVLITTFCFYGTWKKKIIYLIIGFVMLVAGYVLDGQMNGALRVQHLVGQFTSFASYRSVEDAMSDMENLAEFGSDRGAQIIPKIELLTSTQKLMFGFGFLHDDLTTNDKYIIQNEFYSDQSAAEEVAALVEVTQVQTILDTGLVGFVIQHLFYIAIYFLIRKYKYSNWYLVTLVCISIFGIGGFAGLNLPHGLLLLGLSLGGILLANKDMLNPMPSVHESQDRII